MTSATILKKKTPRDYKFIKLIGEGSFSSVYLAVDSDLSSKYIRDKDVHQTSINQYDSESNNHQEHNPLEKNNSAHESSTTTTAKPNQQPIQSNQNRNHQVRIKRYAIKVCQKSHIKKQNKQTAIMREKEIMNILNQHPNKHFIKLHYTFQDVNRLYFVMTYASNGELLEYMQHHPLSLNQARKYTNQLINALEHMHRLNIIHRDLKPENLLLDQRMDILITDFGSATITMDRDGDKTAPSDRRNSFAGTAQYVSPEMLRNRQATNMSDLWALGVIVYQMITNVMPFNAPNEYLIYQRIQNLEYQYPDNFDPAARDLVSSLIKLEPSERLGASDDLKKDGYVSIRRHTFTSTVVDDGLNKPIEYNDTKTNNNYDLDDPDLAQVDKITPGLDEQQLLRLLTLS